MNKNKGYSIKLKLIALLFMIMIFSNIAIIMIYGMIIHLGVINPQRFNPIITATVLLGTSIIISLFVTPVFSSNISRITKEIIKALNDVAKGDFSVQLDEHYFSSTKINEVIINFNKMVRELNSIETLKTDFISNFSHEFKTPIVSMIGFAKLLKDPSTTKEEKDEYINIIINESNRLSNLANNVLLLSKLKSEDKGYAKESTFPIDEQIRQSLLLFVKEWEEKNININIDVEEIKFTGNEELIRQVWINLINNAIKFTNVNGTIEILGKKVDNKYVVKIIDDGIGIEKEKIEHIYDKFYQADTSHSTLGNGLGLAIVLEIIKLYNGTIEVSSKVNKGTTFIVTLPLKEN